MIGIGGWIADLFGYKDLYNGNGDLLPRRSAIRFLGGTLTDNPTLDATDVGLTSVPLTSTVWVDPAFIGANTGSQANPFTSIPAALSAMGNVDCVFMLAPGTYPQAFTITGSAKRSFCMIGYSGIPLVNITGQVTWVITNNAECSWEGCVMLTSGGAGPIFKDDVAGGAGAARWSVIGGRMGVQTNGNAASALFTHDVRIRAAYFRANGFSALTPSAVQPELNGFDVQGAAGGAVGQVQVTEGALAGPGPYKCGFIRMRDSSTVGAQTINTSGSGSSFEGATNFGAGTVLNCTASTAGVISFESVSLYYAGNAGLKQTGTINNVVALSRQESTELTTGAFAVSSGSACALDLLASPRQLITLTANAVVSVAANKYPFSPTLDLRLRFVQDATGGRTPTFSSDFVGTPVFASTAPGSTTIIKLYWSAAAGKFFIV